MTQYFQYITVPYDVLNIHNKWDIHVFQKQSSPILQSVESILSVGILHSPLIKKREDGRYDIITGSRCLSVLQAHNYQENIKCRSLSEGLTNIQILTLLYREYTVIGPLSPIALAYFHQLCDDILSTDEKTRLLTELNLNSKPHFANRILSLLKLNTVQQSGIMNGLISENIAQELLKFEEGDRTALYQLFSMLNIGTGKQKRMLMLIRDIAGRDGIAIKEFLEADDIQQIIKHREMNIPQKTQSLLHLLQTRHSPSLLAAEERFQSWQSQINLPDFCSLKHSQSFENDTVSVNITFKNQTQFETFWAELGPHIKKIHN